MQILFLGACNPACFLDTIEIRKYLATYMPTHRRSFKMTMCRVQKYLLRQKGSWKLSSCAGSDTFHEIACFVLQLRSDFAGKPIVSL